ncbi:MAG: IclR family transcriptional regulator [Ectothiorhodospiraceae bacterium]|nr:IclR family transcriptional regulator [Ectothiorhodospiraceae bacterium]
MRQRPVALIDFQSSVQESRKDRNFVMALARGLEILRAFQATDGMLSNQEIAQRTRIPKPTVSRLTYTLTKLGYLSYSERLERYQLGTGVLALGYSCLASMGIRQVARPLMQQLADEVGLAVSLGSRDRLSMVYLENCQGGGALTLRPQVGSRIPIATTAMGRAFLAVLPEQERQYLMEHIQRKDPENWPEIRDGIHQAVRDYQELGYCMSLGDWERDVNAVGVPLVLDDGADVLAFNGGGPSFHMSRERVEKEIGPRLVALVQSVRSRVSHP